MTSVKPPPPLLPSTRPSRSGAWWRWRWMKQRQQPWPRSSQSCQQQGRQGQSRQHQVPHQPSQWTAVSGAAGAAVVVGATAALEPAGARAVVGRRAVGRRAARASSRLPPVAWAAERCSARCHSGNSSRGNRRSSGRVAAGSVVHPSPRQQLRREGQPMQPSGSAATQQPTARRLQHRQAEAAVLGSSRPSGRRARQRHKPRSGLLRWRRPLQGETAVLDAG